MALLSLLIRSLLLISGCSAALCTRSDPHDGSLCQVRGRVKDGYEGEVDYPYYFVEPQYVPSLTDCADFCARRQSIKNKAFVDLTGCSSFRFDPGSKICQLGSMNITTAINTTSKRHREGDFYDIGCFDCGDLCDQDFNTQLLDNGGFEGKLFGPWSSIGGTSRKGYQSAKAWACRSTPSHRCNLIQPANICKGGLYHMQFSYKMTGGQSYPLYVTFGNWVFKRKRSAQDNWQTIHAFLHYTKNTITYDETLYNRTLKGPEFEYSPDTANLDIDNVSLSRIDLLALQNTKPGSEVLQNGGFETGSIEPWIPYPKGSKNVKIVSPGMEGSAYAVQYHFTGFDTAYLRQKVTVKPNIPYLLRVNIRQNAHDSDLDLLIGLGQVFEPYYPANYYTYRNLVGKSHQVAIPFVVPYDNFIFSLKMDSFFPEGGGKITLDNFSIQELSDIVF